MDATFSVAIEQACKNCDKTGFDLRSCSRCKRVWYCSKECQKADWKKGNGLGHRSVCTPRQDTDAFVVTEHLLECLTKLGLSNQTLINFAMKPHKERAKIVALHARLLEKMKTALEESNEAEVNRMFDQLIDSLTS